MVEFLESEEFKRVYPLYEGKYLDEGSDGVIYTSGKYAIKAYNGGDNDDDGLITLFRELNFYSFVSHSNILKPVCWTYHDFGYLAMPLGMPIRVAYIENLITIDQIIYDVLSAIIYMSKLGIYHNDIGERNIIFHDGKAKFIDWGAAIPFGGIGYGLSSFMEFLNEFGSKYLVLAATPIIIKYYRLAYTDVDINSFEYKYITYDIEGIWDDTCEYTAYLTPTKSYDIELTPEILMLKNKFNLKNKVTYLMFNLIDQCNSYSINTKLLTYIAMKLAIHICYHAFDRYEISYGDIVTLLDNEVDIDDCQNMVLHIMHATKCNVLQYPK